MPWLSSTDQVGNILELPTPPQRIISLVPSQTELLFDLGLEERVVGITRFCVHPEHWRKSKAIVGGTKKFDFGTIKQLRPDLIIGNKEENYKEGILRIQQFGPVWMSDIAGFDDAMEMIRSVSLLTDREGNGIEIGNRIQKAFESLKHQPPVKALYLMWRKPWMGAADNTFIHSMMEKIGLINVLDKYERYPELSVDMMQALNPEVVLLSSEPYPFSKKHISEILDVLPSAQVRMVDGEMFSWYGSRLAVAPAYFNSLKLGR